MQLGRKALLHLQAACEHLDTTRQFAETYDFAVGQITYGYGAEKRQYMVLAQRVEFNVAHHYHL